MCVITNLTYNPTNPQLKEFIEKKGVEQILDTLEYFNRVGNIPIC